MTLDEDLLIQSGQAVHRFGESILHIREALDGRSNQFEHPHSFRLFGPTWKSGFFEITRQPDAAGHYNAIIRTFSAGAVCRRNEKVMNIHGQTAGELVKRAVVCLISSRKMAASSKSSSSMALVSFFCMVFIKPWRASEKVL